MEEGFVFFLFFTIFLEVHCYPKTFVFFLQKSSTRLHTKENEILKKKIKISTKMGLDIGYLT
jgi:hypothetical protein